MLFSNLLSHAGFSVGSHFTVSDIMLSFIMPYVRKIVFLLHLGVGPGTRPTVSARTKGNAMRKDADALVPTIFSSIPRFSNLNTFTVPFTYFLNNLLPIHKLMLKMILQIETLYPSFISR